MTSPVPLIPQLPVRRVHEMGIKELERIRLILRGGSVVEWRRLHFKTRAEVDRFIRLCQIDPTQELDQRWARQVLADAVEYLRKTFNYRVAEAVTRPRELHELFLYASGVLGPKRNQKIACIVLKVMHVIQHIEGRDILFKLNVSEAKLCELAAERVRAVFEEMKSRGLPVVSFSDSIKTRDSIITKLLAKKETLAAQIYDKTRFRIVTQDRTDILSVLYFLTQRLFPFNFVVPTQTENSLIPFKSLLQSYEHFSKLIPELQLASDYEDREKLVSNRFSGSDYRVLNFVVDLPLRLDAFLPNEQDSRDRLRSRIGFVLVEFQIVDRQTALVNEEGENAHERYKRRQKQKVLRRLSSGLVVPKTAD